MAAVGGSVGALVPSQNFALKVQIRGAADNGSADRWAGVFAPAEISQRERYAA
jgi:hypothetical protein